MVLCWLLGSGCAAHAAAMAGPDRGGGGRTTTAAAAASGSSGGGGGGCCCIVMPPATRREFVLLILIAITTMTNLVPHPLLGNLIGASIRFPFPPFPQPQPPPQQQQQSPPLSSFHQQPQQQQQQQLQEEDDGGVLPSSTLTTSKKPNRRAAAVRGGEQAAVREEEEVEVDTITNGNLNTTMTTTTAAMSSRDGASASAAGEGGLVHVIHTRFMQHQPDEKHLARARLELFRTFTLPSVLQQSNPNFIWILWVEPLLEEQVRRDFLTTIRNATTTTTKNASNTTTTTRSSSGMVVVVIGSREKPVSFRNREFYHKELMTSRIYAGNRDPLLDYQRASESRALIETNLDADDAIFIDFVQTVQAEAISSGLTSTTNTTTTSTTVHRDFRIWCASSVLFWGYHEPPPLPLLSETIAPSQDHRLDSSRLSLPPLQHRGHWYLDRVLDETKKTTAHKKPLLPPVSRQLRRVCPTGAYTIGMAVGTLLEDLPLVPRLEIHRHVPPCSFVHHKCLVRIHAGAAEYPVLRSRTPAAVGVADQDAIVVTTTTTTTTTTSTIHKNNNDNHGAVSWQPQQQQQQQEETWNLVRQYFGVTQETVIQMRERLESNMIAILLDGMQGACTPGHSCKRKDKDALKKLLLHYKNKNKNKNNSNNNNNNNNNKTNKKKTKKIATTNINNDDKENANNNHNNKSSSNNNSSNNNITMKKKNNNSKKNKDKLSLLPSSSTSKEKTMKTKVW